MNAVALGGTFAPPTLAHYHLMREAMAMSKADMGVWIPSSMSYMHIWRPDDLPEAKYLQPEHRLGMLEAMIGDNERMEICTREIYKSAHTYTYDTLRSLKPQFDKVFFAIGTDNLMLIEKWHKPDALISEFPLLVAARREDDVRAIIEGSEFLSRHADNIRIVDMEPSFRYDSATLARSMIAEGRLNEARALLHPKVLDYIVEHIMPEGDA